MEFPEKIYQKISQLSFKIGMIINPGDFHYPLISLPNRKLSFETIKNNAKNVFNDNSFRGELYVHFPFCATRCKYCKFPTMAISKSSMSDNFLDSLEREIRGYEVDFSKIILDGVYIGGGTPSLLNEKQINRFMTTIYKFFATNKKTQVALEGNANTLTKERIKAWKDLGVNRIAMGVQTLNDETLKKVNCSHTSKDVFRAFNLIKKIGIKTAGIELLAGLPGESRKTYLKTVSNVLSLSPDWVNFLLFRPGFRTILKNFYSPSDISLKGIFQLIEKKFTQKGYIIQKGNAYTFLKGDTKSSEIAPRSLLNIFTAPKTFCLGLGPGAYSTFSGIESRSIADMNLYLKKSPPSFNGLKRSLESYKRNVIMSYCASRRSLDKGDYLNIFGSSIEDDFPKEIQQLKKKGVISEKNNEIKWHLGEKDGFGHEAFILHVLKYWYEPKYIKQILKDNRL